MSGNFSALLAVMIGSAMRKLLMCALSLSLLAGSAGYVFAEGNEQQRPNPQQQGHQQQGGYQGGQGRGDHSDWRKGARMQHDDWNRGQRIDYRDYRDHHLRRPQRGYEWREIDGRFVLGVIATGVIADIILRTR